MLSFLTNLYLITESTEMDDYDKLSLLTGYMCAAADTYLGGTYFQDKGRAKRWELTWEFYEELKQEALAKGVPESYLDNSKMLEIMKQPEFENIVSLFKNQH